MNELHKEGQYDPFASRKKYSPSLRERSAEIARGMHYRASGLRFGVSPDAELTRSPVFVFIGEDRMRRWSCGLP
jgi:hypothetical protein